eukprot:TRINITY_DN14865_c0_g1_i1.p1 TRINITY_DN14865_c0_g1~~TRINITY_DN14865_c0_g1_i1.p1  ORF type:complete len:286 (-),score=72.16 TRINITY_DN14865_c0_g1_i1:119-976(-)
MGRKDEWDSAAQESVMFIQRAFRGMRSRKNFSKMLGKNIKGVEAGPWKQMLPARVPGHPSDRELLAKARFQKVEDFARKHLMDESSYDGASTVALEEVRQAKLPTPLPAGMPGGTRLTLTEISAGELAFERLDDQHKGALDRMRSRMWLRCMGWVVSNEQLDRMLSGSTSDDPHPRRGYEHSLWTLKNLQDVAEANDRSPNGSVEELAAAILRLNNGKNRISQARLVEVTAAHSDFLNDGIGEIFELMEINRPRTIECSVVAEKVLQKICDPPPTLDRYSPKGCA